MKKYCCFDVGGTYIKYGIVDENGELLFKELTQTPKENTEISIPSTLCDIASSLQDRYAFESIGVSTAGIVDIQNGSIIYANNNIPGYTGTEISKQIYSQLGLNCKVENDVNAAAIGELWKGEAIHLDDFICITIGTGIGTAIVINKKIYRGHNQLACYGGEMIINKSSYESQASTTALIDRYKKANGKEKVKIDGEYIFAKIKEGDKIALEIYSEYVNDLVIGLLNLVYIFDPGTIIIGGGISAEKDILINSIKDVYKNKGLPMFVERNQIRMAKLGNDAALYGMAHICANSIRF